MQSKDIALRASFTALVFIATAIIPPIPISATGGYLNFGETVIYACALLFGGITGGFAGGVGAAMADIFLGFGSFAPITLIVKGIEGYVVGTMGKGKPLRSQALAVIVGGVILVVGYFVFEVALFGLPAAVTEVPFNMLQAGVGLVVALTVVRTVRTQTSFLRD
jgi:uncharacterized membrane protein